jgi:hypothetical protein
MRHYKDFSLEPVVEQTYFAQPPDAPSFPVLDTAVLGKASTATLGSCLSGSAWPTKARRGSVSSLRPTKTLCWSAMSTSGPRRVRASRRGFEHEEVDSKAGQQSSQSSMTTLSREQMPADFLSTGRLTDYALHRVYADAQWPNARQGQQQADADANVQNNAWIASTIQVHAGGWTDVANSPITLTGFKGGSLYFEYGCNVYANNIFARGLNEGKPGSPGYMRMRVLVNGVSLVERRGKAFVGRQRIFGTGFLPAGDLVVQVQFRLTDPSGDANANTVATAPLNNIVFGHVYSGRYLAVGRWR